MADDTWSPYRRGGHPPAAAENTFESWSRRPMLRAHGPAHRPDIRGSRTGTLRTLARLREVDGSLDQFGQCCDSVTHSGDPLMRLCFIREIMWGGWTWIVTSQQESARLTVDVVVIPIVSRTMVTVICPTCGYLVPVTANFCTNCRSTTYRVAAGAREGVSADRNSLPDPG